MFIGKVTLINFADNLTSASTGVVRQQLKYNILNILTRANKTLLLDDVNLNKYNIHSSIDRENIKQLGSDGSIISSDFKIYEPHFDFIFVGHWTTDLIPDINWTPGKTYFGYTDKFSSLKETYYNRFTVYTNDNILHRKVNDDPKSIADLTFQQFYALLEEDIRDYNIDKITK
jgi:hypothetical protein